MVRVPRREGLPDSTTEWLLAGDSWGFFGDLGELFVGNVDLVVFRTCNE